MASTITTEVKKITPKLAEDWLSANTHNRPIRNRHVESLRGAIERGEWKYNGDPIRFDSNGVLIDGQHRLWAIALSEITVESSIIRGLAPEAQMTVDTGARRSLNDQLRLMGHKSASNLGAALVGKWRFDNGLMQTTLRPTIAQGLAVLADNPTITESVRMFARLRNAAVVVHSGAAALMHYEMSSVDADAADEFFERLIDGAGLAKDSPILRLRERLIATRTSTVVQAALFIKAWNAYMEGRGIDNLMWRPVGTNAEAFPAMAS